MTTIAHDVAPRVIGGVDTHKDIHVAAAIDELGRLLGTDSFPNTLKGYRQLWRWLNSHGAVISIGIEGTSSWGAGLARHLMASTDAAVLEVNRPDRQSRRRRGKSDPLDAEAAARAVLSGAATVIPKSRVCATPRRKESAPSWLACRCRRWWRSPSAGGPDRL
jgi:transposase